MLRFKDNILKQKLIDNINKLMEIDDRYLYIHIDSIEPYYTYYEQDLKITDYLKLIKCENEEYNQREMEDLFLEEKNKEYVINGKEEVSIYLDEHESKIECTINELIELIDKVEDSSINDDGICISKEIAIIRVSSDILYSNNIGEIYTIYDEIPEFHSVIKYKENDVNLCISRENKLYYLRVFLNMEFNEDNPVISYDDLFIEISFDSRFNMKLDDINQTFNTYIYEIFIRTGVKLELNPRVLYYDTSDEPEFHTELNINPKLFTKGMNDIITMFNKAEGHNSDRAIVEYVKVIEYVGTTVIRQKVTLEVQEKLAQLKGESPTVDYIRDLGEIYLKNNKINTSDSEIIKAAIKECCEIKKLVKYAPKFLTPLRELNNKISKQSSNNNNNEELCKEAYAILASSISDTRNNLSHAKANYNKKGNECPDIQKEEFIILLRHVCIQIIEWFSNTDESIRIVKGD